MGSFLCLPARGGFVTSTSLLFFHLSRTDECMGNGGPGSLIEHSATTRRLSLGLLDLEGDVFGLSALLARDRVEDLFLGHGRRRVRAKMAHQMFARLVAGMTAETLWSPALARNVGRSKIPAKRQGTNWRALTRARARLPGKFPPRKCPRNPVFSDEEGYPCFVRFGLLFVRMSDCCLQGIQTCECKGEGHRWVGNQVFR